MNSSGVIFLLGPTACGKTRGSIQLAQQLDAEIISVDSALVYTGMDIGTAKPDKRERAGVEHHLIDICTPDTVYSVARFCADALAAIADVQARGKKAILTGGTMLYFNALEKGIAPLPEASPEVRKALNDEALRIGWPAMHKKLARVDPAAATRIHPNDPQRLQRALEVHELTGVALTALQQNTQPLLPTPPIKFALLPDDRAWLHERIAHRFALMLNEGLLDEVETLQCTYNLHAELPSMRSVGYRQAWEFMQGMIDQDTMIDKAIAATRQLAKRQLTWIRGMQQVMAVNCDHLSVSQQVQRIKTDLHDRGFGVRGFDR